jgi:F-type H+-transporting ATPase subunit delta
VADKSTLARPYARAVFQLAQESGSFERWSQRLALGAAALRNEQVRRHLDDPRRTPAKQVELLLDLCGERTAPDLSNFFRTLADNGRLGVLPEIAAAYESLRDEAEGRIEVEVRSAAPLSDATRASLKRRARAAAVPHRRARERHRPESHRRRHHSRRRPGDRRLRARPPRRAGRGTEALGKM